MPGREARQRRLDTLEVGARVGELAAEEILSRRVGGPPRVLVGLEVRLYVRGADVVEVRFTTPSAALSALGVVKRTSTTSAPRTSRTDRYRM